jgi:hypothetical protein
MLEMGRRLGREDGGLKMEDGWGMVGAIGLLGRLVLGDFAFFGNARFRRLL